MAAPTSTCPRRGCGTGPTTACRWSSPSPAPTRCTWQEPLDGTVAVAPDASLCLPGKPAYGQVALCYGPDESESRKRALDQWRWFGLQWPVLAELPDQRAFDAASAFVTEDDVAAAVPCGPDLEQHVAAVRKYVDAGFTDIALVQIGGGHQEEFLAWSQSELLPALRAADDKRSGA